MRKALSHHLLLTIIPVHHLPSSRGPFLGERSVVGLHRPKRYAIGPVIRRSGTNARAGASQLVKTWVVWGDFPT